MNKQFARYESYKDSGVEWLGEIPSHWGIKKLNSILTVKSEKNSPDLPLLSVYREYGVILKDSRDDNHNVAALDLSGYKVVKNGDFVINKMKAWQGSMGVSQYHGIVSPAYITCNVDYNIMNARYLHALLRCSSYIGEYNRLSYGVRIGQWDMHFEDFKNITLCIIPIEEQKQIADFLDKKTAQIDEAILQKEKMIELLKEYRQVTINNAVTKGLDPNVPMKDSGIEWLGQIPAHWQVKKLKYFGNIYAGIVNKSGNDFSKEIISKFKPFIPFTNICNNFVIDNYEMQYVNIKENENQNIVMNGDLLFLMSSETLDDIGKSAVYLSDEKVYLNSFCKGFRLKVKKNAKYVNYLLNSNSYRAYFSLCGRGFTRINIKQEYINDVPIIDIPTSEQQNIVKFLDKKTAQIDDAISLKQSEIEKLKEYKSTLIDSAVTGKIKV